MDELEIINIIKQSSRSGFIGDDCAYLKELGIVITQDNLVEDVHFKREWYTPYELGYKSAAVNISDILASGADPKYLFLGLSIPNNLQYDFYECFIKGFTEGGYGAILAGGDITGTACDKIFISVTAVGITKGRRISSRSNAKTGYVVVISGEHGASAAGLRQLMLGGGNKTLINAHKMPRLDANFSRIISENIQEDYAMMDSSDGLADALFKIAEASNVKITADYSKIIKSPYADKNEVLFGGEDYKLVAALPKRFAIENNLTIIGKVEEYDGIRLKIDSDEYKIYDELNVFKHFGDKK